MDHLVPDRCLDKIFITHMMVLPHPKHVRRCSPLLPVHELLLLVMRDGHFEDVSNKLTAMF